MSERYLVTQSLVSSWAYTFDCFDGKEEEALQEFLHVLHREKREPSDAMRKGIEFERLCYSIADGTFWPKWVDEGEVVRSTGEVKGHYEYPRYYTGAKKIAEIIEAAPVQVKASREIVVDGRTFLVYGILDALKAGTIYDVKFMDRSMGKVDVYGKYLDSPQHPFYFYLIPEAREFIYLLSDGQDLYQETYCREDCRSAEEIISEFIRSLESAGLLEAYLQNWKAKR